MIALYGRQTLSNHRMKPFFSIILPTLGKVGQWNDAVYSVVNQTFKDWELIAIDSGPEENSRPIAARYEDPRITYYNTENANPRLNWDLGYRKATGEYVIWFEDDNYFLPWALETLHTLIEKTGADIATAEHVHWRGEKHSIQSQRCQLIIGRPFFTNSVAAVDPKDVVRRLFGQPILGQGTKARFHNSETAIKKALADAAVAKLGSINFETTSSHALRVAVLTLAKNVHFIDAPVAIVGQTGQGLTETWPYIVSPVMTRAYYLYTLSPVTAQTYSSYRLENMLLAKQSFTEELRDIPVNMRMFLESHAKELRFSHCTWRSFFRAWRELRQAISNPAYQAETLRLKVAALMLEGAAVKILRHIGLFQIFKRLLESRRVSRKSQYILSLGKEGIYTAREASARIPEILTNLEVAYPKTES